MELYAQLFRKIAAYAVLDGKVNQTSNPQAMSLSVSTRTHFVTLTDRNNAVETIPQTQVAVRWTPAHSGSNTYAFDFTAQKAA